MEQPTFSSLKKRHRATREDMPEALSLRIHRALSWLQRAEQERSDDDARFIFLWIAFNAAYANDLPETFRFSETRLFIEFLARLIDRDSQERLYNIVWQEFPGAIRLLLDNRYVFRPFWEYQRGVLSEQQWLERFERSKAAALRALGKMDTRRVLLEVFERLYVLRNQLFHGSATWNGSVNRTQLQHATAILSRLVPAIIDIMLENRDQIWGTPQYPVVEKR